jgi:hypothetical protein
MAPEEMMSSRLTNSQGVYSEDNLNLGGADAPKW